MVTALKKDRESGQVAGHAEVCQGTIISDHAQAHGFEAGEITIQQEPPEEIEVELESPEEDIEL